ncbi:MAG: hypothetical protein JO023_22760 [Chloroflexi bacterium]|nr:hypothetical protein [Chloroflexota bacterium]
MAVPCGVPAAAGGAVASPRGLADADGIGAGEGEAAGPGLTLGSGLGARGSGLAEPPADAALGGVDAAGGGGPG